MNSYDRIEAEVQAEYDAKLKKQRKKVILMISLAIVLVLAIVIYAVITKNYSDVPFLFLLAIALLIAVGNAIQLLQVP